MALALPLTANTPVGEPGAVEGTMALEALEATEVPEMLVAVTVNTYCVPLVRPVTVHEVVADVQVKLPGFEVTV